MFKNRKKNKKTQINKINGTLIDKLTNLNAKYYESYKKKKTKIVVNTCMYRVHVKLYL